MNAKPILVVPRGAITAHEQARIEEAGYLLVQSNSHEQIRLLQPSDMPLAGSTMLTCALDALSGANSSVERAVFVAGLLRELKKAQSTKG